MAGWMARGEAKSWSLHLGVDNILKIPLGISRSAGAKSECLPATALLVAHSSTYVSICVLLEGVALSAAIATWRVMMPLASTRRIPSFSLAKMPAAEEKRNNTRSINKAWR